MVREFQSIIGREARGQCAALLDGAAPDLVSPAWVAGRTRRIFSGFVDTSSRLVGVEAAGGSAIGRASRGSSTDEVPAAQDEEGQIKEAHSISAGLDYPGIGPEHAHLAATGGPSTPGGRRRGDRRALHTGRDRGIICALESAHALAWCCVRPGERSGRLERPRQSLGRGDKDVAQVRELLAAGRSGERVTGHLAGARGGLERARSSSTCGRVERRGQAAGSLPDGRDDAGLARHLEAVVPPVPTPSRWYPFSDRDGRSVIRTRRSPRSPPARRRERPRRLGRPTSTFRSR